MTLRSIRLRTALISVTQLENFKYFSYGGILTENKTYSHFSRLDNNSVVMASGSNFGLVLYVLADFKSGSEAWPKKSFKR